MGDLLSAASLLLAVVGIFYGLWYGEITAALSQTIPTHALNREPVRKEVVRALFGKAFPITLAAVPSAIIFLPDGISIVAEAVDFAMDDFNGALQSYDAVRTAFCFVVLLLVALGTYTSILVVLLGRKLLEIAKP